MGLVSRVGPERDLSLSALASECYHRAMDAITLEQEALKLSPLSRIRLADLLYTSLEVEADRDWNARPLTNANPVTKPTRAGKWGRLMRL